MAMDSVFTSFIRSSVRMQLHPMVVTLTHRRMLTEADKDRIAEQAARIARHASNGKLTAENLDRGRMLQAGIIRFDLVEVQP